MKMGVWGIVNGTDVCPLEDEQAIRKFNSQRDRALANIVLAVEPSLLYLLGDPQDPVVVWKKLCDQFQKKTWANKLSLRRRLYGLKLKENESVQGHIKSMIEIFDELSIIGDAVEEEDRVVHMLASLPESFNMLVTALEASPEVPALELVTERLLHEERKTKEKAEGTTNSNSHSGSLKVNECEDAFFSGNKQKSKGPCFFCDQMGHLKRDCEEFKEYQIYKQKKEKQEHAHFSKAYDSDVDDFNFEDAIALVVSDSLSGTSHNDKDKWIVDSAASSHMCNDVNQFRDLKALKRVKKVKVGNGCFMEAKLEGTVSINLKSRNNKVSKCKLSNVLLVPDMKFNLLSVSKASKKGKKCVFDKHGCKFIDMDTSKVVVTASKIGNLYYVNCAETKRKDRLQREQMKKALINVKERKFEEEFLRRLSTVDDKKKRMDVTVNKESFENSKIKIKEECYQNEEDIAEEDITDDEEYITNEENITDEEYITDEEDIEEEMRIQKEVANQLQVIGDRV